MAIELENHTLFPWKHTYGLIAGIRQLWHVLHNMPLRFIYPVIGACANNPRIFSETQALLRTNTSTLKFKNGITDFIEPRAWAKQTLNR